MKKIVLFLIAFIAITSMNLEEVKAETPGFYEAELLDNIYTRRSLGSTTYYQRSRFFREKGSGRVAYCIEPFTGFSDGLGYIPTEQLENLSEETILKMKLLANYGYLYPGHEDKKWYVITQQSIWQTVQPNGLFEYTAGLNGTAIYPYESETNELWSLVNAHLIQPSFKDQTIHIVENEPVILTDTNHVLSNYQSNDPNISIDNNTLTIHNLTEGTHTFQLTRVSNIHDSPALFYYSATGQNIMTLGNAKDITITITINVQKTKLEIIKIDKDTNSTTPSGEGILIGAKYGLYNSNNQLVQELTINENNKSSIENIPYGSYTLKELVAGEGYQLDMTEYKIEITPEQSIIELSLSNEIIKKKVQIHKEFGTKNQTNPEKNITFDIYDNNNQLITSIITDENGYAETLLPYGSYIIKQRNSTENYKAVEDFPVAITEKDDNLDFQLYDYKIEVPNTHKDTTYSLYMFILINLGGFYVLQRKNI